jgi:raffinose/stachyose/melibiose transport system permease protein
LQHLKKAYPRAFYLPASVIYLVIFLVPTGLSFYFAFTRWTLFDSQWIGLDNFRQFFSEEALLKSLRNTLVYAVVTSGLKVIVGMALAVLVTSRIRLRGTVRSMVFFPVIVSPVAVGLTFLVLMHPTEGLYNRVLEMISIDGPHWLTDVDLAIFSVALVDVWKGLGLAMVIYIAGIMSVPQDLYEAVSTDGGGWWHQFRHVTLPLSRPATFTVILFSFVGGLRSFELIWTMTGGGPGFASDVIASTIFKQYQAGFYGLATAGNVILFFLVTALVVPLTRYFARHELPR